MVQGANSYILSYLQELGPNRNIISGSMVPILYYLQQHGTKLDSNGNKNFGSMTDD